MLGSVAFYALGYGFAFGANESRFVGNHGFFLEGVSKCDYVKVFFQYTFAGTSY